MPVQFSDRAGPLAREAVRPLGAGVAGVADPVGHASTGLRRRLRHRHVQGPAAHLPSLRRRSAHAARLRDGGPARWAASPAFHAFKTHTHPAPALDQPPTRPLPPQEPSRSHCLSPTPPHVLRNRGARHVGYRVPHQPSPLIDSMTPLITRRSPLRVSPTTRNVEPGNRLSSSLTA